MTTTHSGHGRFSRVGFNFGLKSQSELRNREAEPEKAYDDEDWYIPYTGTYEPPPGPRPSRNKDRDSWGDPIFGLGTVEGYEDGPHVHYDDDLSDREGLRSSEESRVRGRGRTQSVSSNYTASTGIDHGRASQAAQRRYHTTSSRQPPTPSYVRLDVEGVGESPVPQLRQPKDRPLSHRGSLASIFTFGVKSPSSPAAGDRGVKLPQGRPSRPSISSGVEIPGSGPSNDHRRTISGDSTTRSVRTRRGAKDPLQSIDSRTTTEEDYYNSYYSTLLQTPVKPQFTNPNDPLSSFNSPPPRSVSSSSQHPYALVVPPAENHGQSQGAPIQPKSAPPASRAYQLPPAAPKLTFSLSHSSAQPAGSNSALPAPRSNTTPQRMIKSSISTPDLKAAKSTSVASRNVPKGIDRWLSAETWCDALLFPRPRLKIKNERGSGSGRIVSPPGSPVLSSELAANNQTDSVPSRVLAHSRSLINLREGSQDEPWHENSQAQASLTSPPTASQAHTKSRLTVEGQARTDLNKVSRPLRPRSWASDDLDLPSPVPSLARVLEDGARLESDRKEWQSKAAGSWGNKRSRSVSRSRSKSLTAKGRKTPNQAQSSIDFLAARAVHGNQDLIPTLPSTPKHKRAPSSQQGTNSHSHSRNTSNSHTQAAGSPIRTLTHSSKSPSRDHSRNDSWSKSAIKAVKASAPCFNGDATTTPTDEKSAKRLENGLQKNEVQGARQQDPAVVIVTPSSSLAAPPLGPSPTPSNNSGVTDPRVGIAISTPFTDESFDRENLRLASHPYARNGLYTYTAPAPAREKCAEYAGPHPVQNLRPADVLEGPAARHKLPPHVALSHPYAQPYALSYSPASRDSYDERLIHHHRPDSNVPPAAKMWAPLAPGVVREILPTDLKYSPFIDADGKLEGDMAEVMAMSGIVDTVGVGEALAYATECQEREGKSARDSGLGTSENIHGSGSGSREVTLEVEAVEEEEDMTARFGSPSRIPVQYDVLRSTRRLQQQHIQRTPDTGHTFASSPLEYPFTPKLPEFIRAEMANLTSPGVNSSESSSQRNSPRPLGSPNDLVGFQDLFFKPGHPMSEERRRMASSGEQNSNESQSCLSNIPFDLKSSYQRPTSSLTNLARKLSQEYEQISNRGRSESQYSLSSSSGAPGSLRPSTARRPTDASLEFVFERMPRTDSPTQGMYTDEHEGARSSLPFEPQENIPEDVNSRSSIDTGKGLEPSEDETEVFHVKHVETATPAEVDNDRRLSYAGQLGFHTERHDATEAPSMPVVTNNVTSIDHEGPLSSISSPTSQARVLSGLQVPPSDNTRSSYVTTSTMSHMSGLSDFPVPPKDFTNHRMSLLSAFFNDAGGRPSISIREDASSEPLPSQILNSNNHLTFGVGADAEEIVEALSNSTKRI